MRIIPFVLIVISAFCIACESDPKNNDVGEIGTGTDAFVDTSSDTSTKTDTSNLEDVGPDEGFTPPEDVTGPYFDIDRVLDIVVEIPAADWDTLRNQTRTIADILAGDCLGPRADIFTWFRANVTVDGTRLENVGIRKKGFLGSLSTTKPSLKFKFDRYVDGQLLDGVVERMTLNNSRQDPSKLNTCLSYATFAAAGIVAPRCNFARVTINDAFYGVFIHVEPLKKRFLRQHFADAEGKLYEGTLSDFREGWEGTFEQKTNDNEMDTSDLEAVKKALLLPDEQYLDALKEIVDVDQFLTFWATEVIIGHWDGYNGNRNNFYIYREPTGTFSFIPWGADAAFKPIDNPFNNFDEPQSVMAASGIGNRLYNDPIMRIAYHKRLGELLKTVWDPTALLALTEKIENIVQENALEQLKATAASDTVRVKEFIKNRRGVIEAELQSPVEWPVPLAEPDICWEEQGNVEITFSTQWGTKGNPAPLSLGTVTITTWEVNGQPRVFEQAGVTSGPETNDQGQPLGEITVYAINSQNIVDVLNLRIPIDTFEAGGKIEMKFGGRSTFIRVFPPNNMPQFYGHMPTGTVELDMVSTENGQTISGTIRGKILEF